MPTDGGAPGAGAGVAADGGGAGLGVGSPEGGDCASCGATGWGGVGVDSVLAPDGCCGAGGAAGALVPGC